MNKIIRHGNIEVRLNDDGTLDEVVMYDQNGKCVYHLEQMSDCLFWMRFYGDQKDLVVNFCTHDERLHLPEADDELLPRLSATYEFEDTYERRKTEVGEAKIQP